jgi:uncharacterized protein (TIGR02646 family)
MIRIDRGPTPFTIKVYASKNSLGLDGVTSVTKAEEELENATAFFTNPSNYVNEVKLTKTGFNFTVYKNPELTRALARIFGTKCAYCESRFGAVTPREIEHFRPKSEIETGSGSLRPGYFWLAGEWDNLLVSCVDCNRPRYHQVPGQPEEVKLGKGTQFPLSDESKRVRSRGIPLADEELVRELLNPCVDSPEQHLTFDDDGLIHPMVTANGDESVMGSKSIFVCALQRKGLVENRLVVLNDLKFKISQLIFLTKNQNELKKTGSSVAANAAQIRAATHALKELFKRDAPYQAMLRYWLRVGKERGDFDILMQFGIDLLDLIQV